MSEITIVTRNNAPMKAFENSERARQWLMHREAQEFDESHYDDIRDFRVETTWSFEWIDLIKD